MLVILIFLESDDYIEVFFKVIYGDEVYKCFFEEEICF